MRNGGAQPPFFAVVATTSQDEYKKISPMYRKRYCTLIPISVHSSYRVTAMGTTASTWAMPQVFNKRVDETGLAKKCKERRNRTKNARLT